MSQKIKRKRQEKGRSDGEGWREEAELAFTSGSFRSSAVHGVCRGWTDDVALGPGVLGGFVWQKPWIQTTALVACPSLS